TREFLLDQGFTELNSPKATMRKAFSYGLIDDEQAWIVLLNARNQTSHLYDDATAQEIYSQIESEFVSLFDKLIEQLKCG
ncbi:MAG: HI0074 family nucleotidyltransferase substrate-binding subunit, partial [Ruminococcus sp.]